MPVTVNQRRILAHRALFRRDPDHEASSPRVRFCSVSRPWVLKR